MAQFLTCSHITEEELAQKMSYFKNHKATVITEDEDYFVLDFRNPETSEYSVTYILDKKKGVLILYGDLGEAVLSWYSPQSAENIARYCNDVGYFAGKIKTSSDLYERRFYDSKSDLKRLLDKVADGLTETEYTCFAKERESIENLILSFTEKRFMEFPEGAPDDVIAFTEKYRISNVDIRTLGFRLSGRVYLWALGFQMAMEQIHSSQMRTAV